MKVVLVGRYNLTEFLNGPEKFAKRLYWNLRKQNINVIFITYFFKEDRNSSFYKRLFGFQSLDNECKIHKMGWIRILFFLLLNKQPLVHFVTTERFMLPIILLKSIIRSYFLVTLHGVIADENNRRTKEMNDFAKLKDSLLDYLMHCKTDFQFYLSDKHLNLAKSLYNINEKNVNFVKNGIDKEFHTNKASLNDWGTLNLIFYNGFKDDIDRGLINVIELFDKYLLNITLFILGREIKHKSKNISLKFVGPFDKMELVEFLRNMHIVIKAPCNDTFPIFLLEAMALGVIPILPNNIEVSKYIANEENGFLYDPDNLNELIDIVKGITSNKRGLNQISQKTKLIYKELNWDVVTDEYILYYDSILNS